MSLNSTQALEERLFAANKALAEGAALTSLLGGKAMTQQQREAAEKLKKKQELLESGLFDPSVLETPGNTTKELLAHLHKQARARMGEIPRKDMPQVKAWQAKDDGVPMGKLEFVDPKKLKYTQETINETKAQGIANHWDTVGKEPILISRDNWVIDGHHRVAAARIKNKFVRCYRIDLPGRQAWRRIKQVDSTES